MPDEDSRAARQRPRTLPAGPLPPCLAVTREVV